jgi:hypothetical protein
VGQTRGDKFVCQDPRPLVVLLELHVVNVIVLASNKNRCTATLSFGVTNVLSRLNDLRRGLLVLPFSGRPDYNLGDYSALDSGLYLTEPGAPGTAEVSEAKCQGSEEDVRSTFTS